MTKETPDQGRYAARGVSATKTEVHDAVDKLDQGVFPGAFCKVVPDVLTGDPKKCNLIHADGSGTKSLIAYLHYKETGEASIFRGIAQDSIVMNLDDLLCVGATGPILFNSTVNRNARNFDGKALAELINGNEAFLAKLREFGVNIVSGGGETADVGDITDTVTVDSCAVAVMDRDQVITGQKIVPGLAIIGISSAGQATYEDFPNSGIGSNGLTSARHELLSHYYAEKYPETFDKATDKQYVYCGPYKLGDTLPGSDMSVGQALLSPTRTYAPIITKLLAEQPEAVRGLVHCSGGGQGKCLRFGQKVHFVKDKLMPLPPIFKVIREVSGTSWKEMYQVFNMGHRMEVYCPHESADTLLEIIRGFGVEAQVIGHTEESQREGGQNHLTLTHEGEALEYAL